MVTAKSPQCPPLHMKDMPHIAAPLPLIDTLFVVRSPSLMFIAHAAIMAIAGLNSPIGGPTEIRPYAPFKTHVETPLVIHNNKSTIIAHRYHVRNEDLIGTIETRNT